MGRAGGGGSSQAAPSRASGLWAAGGPLPPRADTRLTWCPRHVDRQAHGRARRLKEDDAPQDSQRRGHRAKAAGRAPRTGQAQKAGKRSARRGGRASRRALESSRKPGAGRPVQVTTTRTALADTRAWRPHPLTISSSSSSPGKFLFNQ